MHPVIAITTKTEELRGRSQTTLPAAYAEAIEGAGGIPIILPLFSQKDTIAHVAHMADGFLFSGGDDIDPSYYGEKPLLPLELSPDARTDFEIALLQEALRLGKPVLGICLGAQLINVALGGGLIQDIPTQVEDSINHRSGSIHEVFIKKGTLLSTALGGEDKISVMSAHHQSVKSAGRNLVISAYSIDNVVEAVEMKDYPFLLGVQWHPERDLKDEHTRRLFRAFIDMAGKKCR